MKPNSKYKKQQQKRPLLLVLRILVSLQKMPSKCYIQMFLCWQKNVDKKWRRDDCRPNTNLTFFTSFKLSGNENILGASMLARLLSLMYKMRITFVYFCQTRKVMKNETEKIIHKTEWRAVLTWALALAPDIDLSHTEKIITLISANDINTGDVMCVHAFRATWIPNGRKYLLSHVN